MFSVKPYNPWKYSILSECAWKLRRFCPIRLREAQNRWYDWAFRVWERFSACSLTTVWLPISKSDDRHFAVYLINALVAQLDRVTDSDSVGRTFESCRAYQKCCEIVWFHSIFIWICLNFSFWSIAQPDRAFRKIAQISKLLCIIWLAAFLFLSNAWV